MSEFQLIDPITNHSEQYFTEDNIPDPTPLPGVARFNILVRPMPVKKKSKGGVLLPNQAKDNIHYLQTAGRVIAMGPDCFNREDTTPSCKVGDYVVWGRGRGIRIKYKGVAYLILVDDEVLMTIPDPTDLDENYFVDASEK